MTPAERPTQEVAPRTAAGDEAHQRSHAISKWGCPAKRGEPCIIALNIAQAEDQAAEASRSARPAAVTAEQLAKAIRAVDRYLFAEGHGESLSLWRGGVRDPEGTARLILSKITPAQPSASSEEDGE